MLSRTSTTLLNSLLEEPADQRAWRRFCESYGPAIFRFARRRGLSEQEADEVLAETLGVFYQAYRAGQYERDKGRLRTWVFGMAMNKLREARRRRLRRKEVSLEEAEDLNAETPKSRNAEIGELGLQSAIRNPQSELPLDSDFDDDVERTMAWQCLDAVRGRVAPLTYQAFDLYVVKGRSAEDTARILGIDRSAVYVAKSRVLGYARREYERLKAEDTEANSAGLSGTAKTAS